MRCEAASYRFKSLFATHFGLGPLRVQGRQAGNHAPPYHLVPSHLSFLKPKLYCYQNTLLNHILSIIRGVSSMYRILSAVVCPIRLRTSNTGSGRPDKPDLEPSYSLNHGIFIAQISPPLVILLLNIDLFRKLAHKAKTSVRSELSLMYQIFWTCMLRKSAIRSCILKFGQQKVLMKGKKSTRTALYYLRITRDR